MSRPVPVSTATTAPYWEHAARGELVVQRCGSCGAIVPDAREVCPVCWASTLSWVPASGRARLWSFVIVHQAEAAFVDEVPYVLAVVELEEGPRMLTRIVEVDPVPESMTIDMPLEVRFARFGEATLPVFAPVGGSR